MSELNTELLDENETSPEAMASHSAANSLPYANSVFYKGISSLILTLSIFGFIYAVYLINIAFTRGKEMRHMYEKAPEKFDQKSIQRTKTGVLFARIATLVALIELALFMILF